MNIIKEFSTTMLCAGLVTAMTFSTLSINLAQADELDDILNEIEAELEAEINTEMDGETTDVDVDVTVDTEVEEATDENSYENMTFADIQNLSLTSESMESILADLASLSITKFGTTATFMAEKPVRRDEAAKMLVLASKNILNKSETSRTTAECQFSDTAEGHSDLATLMVESCQMGLFKGSKGMFLPTREITYGQAITVMMRMLYGYQDETGDHFATNYMKLAYENDYIAKATLDTKAKRDMNIPRGEIAKLLGILIKKQPIDL